MKKMMVLSVLCLICFAGGLMADKTGVGSERGQDRTGSPVGSVQQCGQCHSGGNFGATISSRLKDADGNVVTEYNAGEAYTYEVELGGSGVKFGFQTVALLSNNTTAGTMTAQSSNAKVITINGGRKYAEHTAASTSNLFVMNWVAPVAGSGTVKFYAAGNNVNGNNTSSGDQATSAIQLTITESAVSSVSEKENFAEILLYPNPTESILNISSENSDVISFEIFDLQGRKVMEQEFNGIFTSVDVSSLEKGVYYIVFSGEKQIVKTFMR